MLTVKKPNGEWYVKGVDFKDCTGNMYGALCKLRDYEATGLEPDDFRADSYDKCVLYRVNYLGDDDKVHTFYCQSKEEAERLETVLSISGYKYVTLDNWDCQAFIESE